MSTYYYFRCVPCEEIGGFFSRQVWGWGNADIIDTFKFLMAHTRCALIMSDEGIIKETHEPEIQILSEHKAHDLEAYEEERERWILHRQQLLNIFPCSDDWTFMKDRIGACELEETSTAWEQEQ